MLIHVNPHTNLRFAECGYGLYYYNMSVGSNVTKSKLNKKLSVYTVAKNRSTFLERNPK